MAFHLFNLGAESAFLQEFADQNGLVPEVSDRWQDFCWYHRLHQQFAEPKHGEVVWQVFVTQAQGHTQAAIERLLDLREWRSRL